MRYRFREAIGWVLATVGLAFIGFVAYLAWHRAVIEAMAVALPATIVFHAGMSQVRLAVAARILGSYDIRKGNGAGGS